ncbi:protein PF3D7_1417600 [Achroia grisella]|uniref:protein PF3D7_1417600 n=1 Tax=Achroia grisella TaxID=688607 RepID=UPI0027D25B7E|nr:protein PF3D7_1417600 [Achroia grisella]
MLPLNDELPPQEKKVSKQDTQFVLDTQLIEFIDKVENNNIVKGVTQEFKTSFNNSTEPFDDIVCDKYSSKNNECKSKHNEISNEDVLDKEGKDYINTECVNSFKSTHLNKCNTNIILDSGQESKEKYLDKSNSQLEENCTELIDKCMEIELNLNLKDSTDVELNTSPVLNINKNVNRRSTSSSPLVYNLDSFEKFERIAYPFIEHNSDVTSVKHLINSQILEKELVIQSNFDKPQTLSPVIKINNNKLNTSKIYDPHTNVNGESDAPLALRINMSPDLRKHRFINSSKDNIKNYNNTVEEDELLFSSDEEIHCEQKNSEDIPFTCAIQTSFYDQSDILDKTMYVGFQTASNKSIQISTVSFTKAKSLLNDVEQSNSINNPSVSELVEMCDGLNSKHDGPSHIDPKKIEIPTFQSYDFNINIDSKISNVSKSTNYLNEDIQVSNEKCIEDSNKVASTKETLQNVIVTMDTKNTQNSRKALEKKIFTEKRKVGGFMTASNKRIKLSDNALTMYKTVFKDIDLSENFEENEEFNQNIKNVTMKVKSLENTEFTDNENKSLNLKYIAENNANDYAIKKNSEDIATEVFHGKNFDMLHCDNNVFGFRTANNEDIKISEASMAKSRKMFEDINYCDNLNDCNENSKQNYYFQNPVATLNQTQSKKHSLSSFLGFKTASNKAIIISEEAIAKSKNLLDIELNECNVKSANTKVENSINEANKENMSGYTCNTLKGKKEMFNSSNANRSCQTEIESDIISEENQKSGLKEIHSIEFRTASNKIIDISQQALCKTKNIFKDIEISEVENSKVVTQNDDNFGKQITPNNFEFVGFRTANNKDIAISKQALANTKMVFQDIDYSEFKDPLCKLLNIKKKQPPIDQKSYNVSNHELDFVGFKTASNKDIDISEKAMVKAGNILQDIENINVLYTEGITGPHPEFKTTNTKVVNISEALQKSKSLSDNIHANGFNASISLKSKRANMNVNENNLVIEEVAISNSNSMKDINHPVKISTESRNDIDTVPNVSKINHKFIGFMTANNKAVNISSEALSKAKLIFEDIDKADNLPNHKQNEPFPCFQTASNKEVIISNNALDKAKNLLRDININPNYKIDSNNDSELTNMNNVNKSNHIKETGCHGFSFKNANDKDINISKDALNMSNKNKENVTDNLNTSLDKLINTQVIDNFDQTLYTEDFLETPKQLKRSGSPILSCPRAKKRKQFVTPYRNDKTETSLTTEVNIKIIDKPIINPNYNCKTMKKISLKDVTVLENGDKKDIDPYLLNFTFRTLLKFEFLDQRNDLTDNKMDVETLKSYFLKDVNKKLIPDKWLDNHIKLILWKLISYELKFPNVMNGSCKAGNVIKQLQYRYQRELYNAERPAIRKILERDDTAAKCLVLCVVDIITVENNSDTCLNTELLLSDGWYNIRACIDKLLTKHVRDGKIKVGTKLITSGAELLNCEQGVAPWEDTSTVRLKICGNSTRRARWDARLGYHGNGAILSRLSNVAPDGGKVGRLRVVVTRVYPPLYVEKFEDGSTVTRSERLEYIHQMKYEADRQAMMEKLYEEVEKELSDEDSVESQEIGASRKSMDTGSQIARLLKNSRDPSEFRANLTESQRNVLEEYNARNREKLLENIHARVKSKMDSAGLIFTRNTIPLLKVRVADVRDRNGNVEVTKALLSIWKPNDALTEIITEGAWIELLNVVPTAVRYSELQLSAGRQTTFKQITVKQTDKLKPYTTSLNRTCYPITQLANNPSMVTDYNEVDTAGVIFDIDPKNRDFNSNNQFQNVHIADENKNIICVNFWGGIKKFGFSNVLDTGQIISCVNLQRRSGSTRRCVPQYRATEFTYFTKTPKSVANRKLMEDLVNKISVNNGFIDDCMRIKSNTLHKLRSNENDVTPYRFENHYANNIYVDSPLATRSNRQEEFNLTGLDFESTFKQTDTQELSPKTLQRKKKVNEKINKLKQYGEPPPLSPLNIINRSEKATKSYRSPLLTSDTANVATINKTPKVTNTKNTPKNENISSSPILSVMKTCKSVKPVKLNFNSVAINESNCDIDGFEEDFEGSPPLSLD